MGRQGFGEFVGQLVAADRQLGDLGSERAHPFLHGDRVELSVFERLKIAVDCCGGARQSRLERGELGAAVVEAGGVLVGGLGHGLLDEFVVVAVEPGE